MFKTISPEQAGIRSSAVSKFIRKLQERGLYMHGILLMRGDDIFAEVYWAPFNKNSIHRMYSQTKSFVGIAIGLLAEEGKLCLDDKLCAHFPDKLPAELNPRLAEQTIRQTLTMETTGPVKNWFYDTSAVDRTEHYFRATDNNRPAGMIYEYDSAGSQVLASLVEKLAGTTLLNYLKKKLFDRMGTFQTAKMLQTRNGDSWGDSAMICSLRDIASFGRLLMRGGVYEGERLMNEAYIREATSRIVDNDEDGFGPAFHVGYGYQIWQAPRGGFAFVGMGGQLTIMHPKHDLLFSCIGDNQGYAAAYPLIISALNDFILDELQESPLPEDPTACEALLSLTQSLSLKHLSGEVDVPFASSIDGVTYICEENPMGIQEFSLHFRPDHTGEFRYTNAQGEKILPFGLGKNVFGKFPQLGYSQDRGGSSTDNGFMYDCAASAAWRESQKLLLKVQIIDEYLGNFVAIFAFRDNCACVRMAKTAEHFLDEYHGILTAWAK